ncbi:sigma-54 dependent transcriptional regulator [Hyalangium sp.]|uniref:sigma-54-dependent transcriptional regulator n=1 Tax=Hyalangium sp. TaxID=2028555 RepID=UPI002D4DBCF8|nr:sigma-54 dependent transcriptional regulator [Hyalangium sp.]HYI02829.1 sigma-54 dependent transcriptional regulator [Hyalangium sp.]
MNEQRFLRILIVDDERVSLRHFAGVLESLGNIELHRASELGEARQVLEEVLIDVAFIDLQLSQDIRNRDGLTLIGEIHGRYQTASIVVSGHKHHLEVLEAVKLGAKDYVLKTEFEQRAPLILQKLREELSLKEEVIDFRTRDLPDPTLGLIGTSVPMQNLRALIKKAAVAVSATPAAVLIQGPTGSGKEGVAQALHRCGPHASAPIINLNCSNLVENLMESELFGHVRGAFTGADRDKPGCLVEVGKGTVFLDEVAELDLGLQAKLLRVLEDRTFHPVGAPGKVQQFKGRIIAATHVDLKDRVREKRFRADLYYRLNVLILHVPPLSEHPDDIPALVQHFVKQYTRPLHFTQEAIELLRRRPWPGNVRELKNALERLAIFADTELIDAATLEALLPREEEEESGDELLGLIAQKLLALPTEDKVFAITKALVEEAMRQSDGNITKAAGKLGLHRKSVERLLKKIRNPDSGEDPEE